jgi:two-component system chemotaxis response regulator CheB
MSDSIFVIGGSAGSLKVLLEVLPQLDIGLSFPIVIIVHRKPYPGSVLNRLLANCSKLEVTEVEDKMTILPGCIYIVPPDYHMLFENQTQVCIDFSEKLNFSRPSIDITFRSAAETFKENAVALLLSGANADGVNGLKEIKKYGGTILVQDPGTAEIDYMPNQALLSMAVDLVLKPSEIASYINQLRI